MPLSSTKNSVIRKLDSEKKLIAWFNLIAVEKGKRERGTFFVFTPPVQLLSLIAVNYVNYVFSIGFSRLLQLFWIPFD